MEFRINDTKREHYRNLPIFNTPWDSMEDVPEMPR